MSITDYTKSDGFKNLLAIFTPGAIAIWPSYYYCILIWGGDVKETEALVFLSTIILSLSLGIILDEVGAWLENNIAYKLVPKHRPAVSYFKMRYYWRRYLTFNLSENNRIITKFISEVVVRLKVELGLLVAIPIMVGSVAIIQSTEYCLFGGCLALSIFSIIMFFIECLVFRLTYESIIALHDLRVLLINSIDNSEATGINSPSYLNYINNDVEALEQQYDNTLLP